MLGFNKEPGSSVLRFNANKAKKQINDADNPGITAKAFENFCYDATFRIQENQISEKEKKRQILNKICKFEEKLQNNSRNQTTTLSSHVNSNQRTNEKDYQKTKNKNLQLIKSYEENLD